MAETGRKPVLVCSCEDTMALDLSALRQGLPECDIVSGRHVCGPELHLFRAAASRSGEIVVACTAQAPLFEDLSEDERLPAALRFVNVRETAGWSQEGHAAGPKMAGLIAAGAIEVPPAASVTYESHGVALIYGCDQQAVEAAEKLKDSLDITVLLAPGSTVVPPRQAVYPIRQGRIKTVKGYLGAFEITIDRFAEPAPSSRDKFTFGTARDGAVSRPDILIDLSGLAPLVSAPDLRSGYLRANPASVDEVARIIFEAASLTGTFDKPRYITFHADLCAHQRSRITGCTRCLELCPAGAISSGPRHVTIDPHMCAGCGQCAAACPTGAAEYAVPGSQILIGRLRAMLMAYRNAGGKAPRVLVHDTNHGEAMIDAAARLDAGLPADSFPVAVNEITQVGVEVIAAAFGYGAVSFQLLARGRPRHDLEGLRATLATANTVLNALGYGENVAGLIETDDPSTLVSALSSVSAGPGPRRPASFQPAGGKRGVMNLALRELHLAAPTPIDMVPLTKGSAFGGIDVRAYGCTLCLSCVSACPTHALADGKDRPLLSFDESLCVQCGLCAATCPEKVITLTPRIDFAAYERGPQTVKEEEPYRCAACGKAFGVKSTIERVLAKLEGQHWMFKGDNAKRTELIKMCEDCRVEAAINMNVDPFAGPSRPAPKTSEDYFKERETEPASRTREAEMLKKIDRGEA